MVQAFSFGPALVQSPAYRLVDRTSVLPDLAGCTPDVRSDAEQRCRAAPGTPAQARRCQTNGAGMPAGVAGQRIRWRSRTRRWWIAVRCSASAHPGRVRPRPSRAVRGTTGPPRPAGAAWVLTERIRPRASTSRSRWAAPPDGTSAPPAGPRRSGPPPLPRRPAGVVGTVRELDPGRLGRSRRGTPLRRPARSGWVPRRPATPSTRCSERRAVADGGAAGRPRLQCRAPLRGRKQVKGPIWHAPCQTVMATARAGAGGGPVPSQT